MKRTRRPRLGAQGWQTVMARFAQSGLSARAFCEQERLNIQSLYRCEPNSRACGLGASSR